MLVPHIQHLRNCPQSGRSMTVGTPSSPSLVSHTVESRDILMVVSGLGIEVAPKRLMCGRFDLQAD